MSNREGYGLSETLITNGTFEKVIQTLWPPTVPLRPTSHILDMWDIMERGFDKLSDDEKAQLSKNHYLGENGLRFPGFDANNEDHYGVANHFIKVMGRFTHFSDHYLNSHSQSLESYMRMLPTFKKMLPKLADRDLTADEIASILEAKKHQSM